MTNARDLSDAQLRLDTAIDQLTQPGHHTLDRNHPDTRQTRADDDTAHRNHIAYLRRRLAHARDDLDIDRIHCAMRNAGRAHRARRAAINAATAVLPSLLERLHDAVHGSGGTNGASGAGAYRSAIGLAAADLLHTIRAGVGARPTDDLAAHLHTWQPVDPEQAADDAERWVEDVRNIVEPSRMTEARAPCPICHTRHVWVVEDGQRIQKAAIQINLTRGHALCIAPGCTGRWDRAHFNLLAGVLEQDRDERAAQKTGETRR